MMAAFAAIIFSSPSISLAQGNQPKAFSPKIKTPNTSNELTDKSKGTSTIDDAEVKETPSHTQAHPSSAAPRRLQQHALGVGLGQTFLMGDYGKHGDNKITADILYSYAASYSFDLLVNAHMSEHKSDNEKVKLMGLTTSIKGRFVEYDNLSPYFLGGLGFYAPQAKREINNNGDTKWSKQKVTFGLNFGGGVDLRLNDRYVVGLMGQMHWPFKVQQDNQSDVKGYYFKLLMTGMYLF